MPIIHVEFETDRFLLRNLAIEDANPRYLSWLNETTTRRFIVTASQIAELENLKAYVQSKLESDQCLFLGIFEKETNIHIGNIKYEPIDKAKKYAVMGILIGEIEWRGKGVAQEVILSSAQALKSRLGIEDIILGVELDNRPAIRAYEKMGFVDFSNQNFQQKENTKFMKLSLNGR